MSPSRPDLVECWIFRVSPTGEPEFLLIRRAPGRIFPGLWQCVTGGLEPGERVPMAALREVREEVGFGPAEIEAFYDLDQVTHFYDESPDAIVAGAIFALRVRPDVEPTLSHEHDGARWAEPRGGPRSRGLADLPRHDRPDPWEAAGPGRRALVPPGPRRATHRALSSPSASSHASAPRHAPRGEIPRTPPRMPLARPGMPLARPGAPRGHARTTPPREHASPARPRHAEPLECACAEPYAGSACTKPAGRARGSPGSSHMLAPDGR